MYPDTPEETPNEIQERCEIVSNALDNPLEIVGHKVNIAAGTETGTRANNEDRAVVYLGEDNIRIAVFDGLGGLEGGKDAAQAAAEAFSEAYKNSEPDDIAIT